MPLMFNLGVFLEVTVVITKNSMPMTIAAVKVFAQELQQKKVFFFFKFKPYKIYTILLRKKSSIKLVQRKKEYLFAYRFIENFA